MEREILRFYRRLQFERGFDKLHLTDQSGFQQGGEAYEQWVSIMMLGICALVLCACSESVSVEDAGIWDCTVYCAEASDSDAYVITYSDEQIVSKSGAISLQNRNEFDIVVHLLTDGKEERTAEIPAGGVAVLYQIEKETVYTVGCHADVEENTEIALTIYDGEGAGPY